MSFRDRIFLGLPPKEENGNYCLLRNPIICILHLILVGWMGLVKHSGYLLLLLFFFFFFFF
jgi:hypothetical protein